MEFPAVSLRLPVSRVRTLTVLGIVATTIVWSTIFENDNLAFGAFLAGIAAISILAGGLLLERSPREGIAFGGRAAEIAQGGGFGGGPAAGAGAPVAAQPGGYGGGPGAGAVAQPAGQAPATTPLGGGGTPPAAEQPQAVQPAAARPSEAATEVQPATEAQPAAQASPAIQSAPLVGAPPPPPDRAGQPADWYTDPTGQKRLRYWDGSQWTEHVAD